jgi:hypothetical protein
MSAPDHHVDILGRALVAMMDRRQTAHDCQGDAFFARESLQRRQSLGKLRFRHCLALHGGNHPFEVDHCFSSVNDFHGHKYLFSRDGAARPQSISVSFDRETPTCFYSNN